MELRDSEYAPNLLEVRGLTKRFGSVNVIKDLSFSLKRRSSILIQGPSGCGKTTLLRCIALLEDIDSGEVIFNGTSVLRPRFRTPTRATAKLGVAMVFQQLHLWNHMPVIDNVALPLSLRKNIGITEARDEAMRLLAALEIEEKAASYPASLSGGQRQRVALARALIHEPLLLLLDEITANLDPGTAERVLELVAEVHRRGTSILIISHSAKIPSCLTRNMLSYDTDSKFWTFSCCC